jgi:hypothetical protein
MRLIKQQNKATTIAVQSEARSHASYTPRPGQEEDHFLPESGYTAANEDG